jgi:hypothetical protein
MGDVIDLRTGKAQAGKGKAGKAKKAGRKPPTRKHQDDTGALIAGRPAYYFPLEQVRELAGIGCSLKELAKFFHVADSTIDERMAKDPDFRAAYENGFHEMASNVRRAQLRLAMMDGAPGQATMLVWLGKSVLGQRDDAPAINITNVQAEKVGIVQQGQQANNMDAVMLMVRKAQESARLEQERNAQALPMPDRT